MSTASPRPSRCPCGPVAAASGRGRHLATRDARCGPTPELGRSGRDSISASNRPAATLFQPQNASESGLRVGIVPRTAHPHAARAAELRARLERLGLVADSRWSGRRVGIGEQRVGGVGGEKGWQKWEDGGGRVVRCRDESVY